MTILILDYSVDRSETAAIRRWLPGQAAVTSYFVDADFVFPADLELCRFTHIIHSGSALSILKELPFTAMVVRLIRDACDAGIAQMGICYGHQLLCKALVGAHAVRSATRGLEVGWTEVDFSEDARAALGVAARERVWQHHFDEVTCVPPGAEVMATNGQSEIQAFIDGGRKLFGVQFHPEFDRSAGNRIFGQMSDDLAVHGYDVDAMLRTGPTLDTGPVFFGFFLGILITSRESQLCGGVSLP